MKSGIKGYRTLNTPSPRGGGVSRNHLYLSKIHKYLRAGRRPDFFLILSPKTTQNHRFLLKLDGKNVIFFRLRRATMVIDLTLVWFVYVEWIRWVAWKKLVILSNSTPVATWTLSSWKHFTNKFDGFPTVFVASNVCNCLGFHPCFMFSPGSLVRFF